MKRARFVIIILTLSIISLTGIRVVVANTLSTNGLLLGSLQEKNDVYAKENLILKEKVSSLSSFGTIASEAARLGFVDAGATLTLNASLPLALKQ